MAGPEEIKPVTSAYEYLLTQGVLGVLCVLLIIALVWTIKNLLKAKDDRVSDQEKYAAALHGVNEAVKELTIETHKSNSDMANEVIRSNDSSRSAVTSLEKTNDKLVRVIDDLKNEQVRLNATLAARGT